jgi:alpha-beta hydrolase superfamily lysophospholipase
MELAEREGIFSGGSGVKLHYRGHRVESAPFRAVIALIEAPEDTGRLYADLVQQLTPSGFVLYGCAHQEYRRVPGQTGFLEEWNALYRELDAFLGLVKGFEPDAPVFLAGAHVAGQLVMTFALHHPERLRGVIGFYPRLHISRSRSPIVSLTRALSRIWPAFAPATDLNVEIAPAGAAQQRKPRRTNPERLSSDLAMIEATTSDIAIPVIVIDGEASTDTAEVEGISYDDGMSRRSLKDVELWLDRVLRDASQ